VVVASLHRMRCGCMGSEAHIPTCAHDGWLTVVAVLVRSSVVRRDPSCPVAVTSGWHGLAFMHGAVPSLLTGPVVCLLGLGPHGPLRPL
jgi:hypothetical protein